jgi:predicted oxidoreductase
MTTMSEIQLTPDPRPLGKSGIDVSPLAWGMWRFAGRSADEGRQLIEAAFAAGITLFDTADIYGFDGQGGFGDAETLLGEIFASSPGLRDRMVLATKGGIMPPIPYDQSRAYLTQALDASLKRLRVEQVDLYQVHRPDILTHPQELARTLDDAIRAGKVRAVGVSNFTLPHADALAHFLDAPLVSHQPEFSPLHLEPMTNGLFDAAMRDDMAVLAWSPLGGGRLGDPTDARGQAVAAALDTVAGKFGVGRAAATYSWIMAHPARVIPIVGTQNPDRIAEAADAYKVHWSREDWYAVLVAARGEKLP